MGTRHIARRVLHYRGVSATVYRKSGGTFDPVTSSVTGETITTVTVKGKVSNFNVAEVDGFETQRDDKRFLVPAMDFEDANGVLEFLPRGGDEVVFDKDTSARFHIRRIRVYDTDKAVLLHLRGGGSDTPAGGEMSEDT